MDSGCRESFQVVGPFIGGELAQSSSRESIDVVNPSCGERLLSLPVGCAADVDRAVDSARRAFHEGYWAEASSSFKKAALLKWAYLIEADAADLDALDAAEMGKPVSLKTFGASASAALVRFYAEALDKVTGAIFDSDRGSFVAQRRVARGVVAAVTPWNFPTYNAVLKVAPALAAGNSVIMKPSELSSQSAFRLASLAIQAGIPPGVFNIVPGLGNTVGQALGLHHKIDMLTFTGSTKIGKQMLQYSGQSNMKVILAECGGKSPQIVFDDGVDLEAAGESIAQLLLMNQGQVCSVGSRLLVQRSIEGRLLETLARRLTQVVIGDALDPATTFGPLASNKQCARVMNYIDSAMSGGARLSLGGKRALQDSGGYFVEPTVFTDVSPSSQIAQEEVFGPVLSVIPFADEAEAIQIANGTSYGLIAYVWTASLSTGMRMAKAIKSSVIVNSALPTGEGAGHSASFEPAGQSGIGTEGGIAGLESYLRRQLLWFNHA